MAGDAYAVWTADFKGHAVYVLTDASRGQTVRVLPSVGNNCVSFQIQQGGQTVDLIYTPPDPETLQGRPSGYGVPILFPWPNRIDGGVFSNTTRSTSPMSMPNSSALVVTTPRSRPSESAR